MPKFVFDTEAEWDQNVENVGIQTEDTEISLDAGATPLQLADDFNDGVLDPLWVQGHPQNSLIAAFDPFGLSPPASEEPLGVTNLRTSLAQSFTLPIAIQMSELQLHLELFPPSSPFMPDIILEIQTDNAGEPSGTALVSETIPFASLPPSSLNGWTVFDFSSTLPSLPSGQKLWIVLTTNPVGTSGDNITWQYDLNHDLAGEALKFLNGGTGQWQSQFVPTHDFYFRLSRQVNLNTKPAETGGALRFQYDVTSGSGEHIHTLRNFAQGDWEMEYRFTLSRLAPNFNSGQFIIGMLQGTRVLEDGAARDAKRLHEFRFNIQDNFVVSYEAAMVDQAGTVHTSGSASWPNVNFTGGFIANDPHVFNVKAERVGNGVKYTLYHSDNPANVLLETQTSPDVRTLTGDIHVDMGATSLFNTAFGVAIDVDEIFLNTPPQIFPNGFLRLRHSFGVSTKLQTMEFQRSLLDAGDSVQIQFRQGATIQDLEAAAFGPIITTQPGSFDPGNPQSEFERADLSSLGLENSFFETKILLNSSLSPGPTCQQYILEFTETATPTVTEPEVEPLTIRRHISGGAWADQFVEKSSSLIIDSTIAKLASVFTDQFDGFTIEPEWTVYQRNASIFESFDFLRMDILSVDADAAIVKTDPIPTDINFTVRHKIDNATSIPAGAFYLFNAVAIHNNPTLPTPNDLRIGGIGTGTTHFTIILRRSQFGDGQARIGIVALRDDGTFVGWDENLQQWSAGTQDQIIPVGKENDLFSYDVSINSGTLNSIIVKDALGATVFDTSAQALNIKIFDNQPFLVLGDSDLSDMPSYSGTQQQYDSVETDIPTTGGTTSGFIRFRDTLGAKARLGKITVLPTTNIQIDPAPISIKARSGNTLDELVAASFEDSGQFIPNVNGNELELTNVPPGSFFEVELNLFSQSPGPEIQQLTWEIEPFFEEPPAILSPNAITADATCSSSAVGTGVPEDQATVPNIKDGDPTTQWVSTTGQEGFGVSWSLSIIIQDGATPVEKTIDAIILRNTNFKKIGITLIDINSNPTNVFSGEVLSPDAIITFDPTQAAQIIIAIENAQVANQTKVVGEIYAGQLLTVLPGFDTYNPSRLLIESGNIRTIGGRLIAYRGTSKYEAGWSSILVDTTTKDQVEQVFKDNPIVDFWPEPIKRTREIFTVGWKIESLPFPYSDVFKGAGYTIEAEMTEV